MSPTSGRRPTRHLLLPVVILALAAVFAGCGDDGVDTDATTDTVEERASEAREQAENAFASLRTNGERLLDEIQTRNAPEIKQQLLDQCRDVLDRLRRADSDQVGRVEALCDRIRDTDPSDAGSWREVREDLMNLREG